MSIQWSDQDQAYVVSLPEFGPYACTDGATYEEAAKHGVEALESLIESYQADGLALPEPAKFNSAVAHGPRS
jgi:predicted RNase H-like HicB family nuclease